jgi:regulatory protein
MNDIKKAYNYSIRLLSKRDYSVFKLSKKLRDQNFEQDVVEPTIKKLLELNYLREEQYARAKIKSLLYRGYSAQYIMRKLDQEHLKVNSNLINEMQNDENMSFSNTIDELIQKKLRGKEIPSDSENRQKLKNKVMRFLISKGHSFSDIQNSICEYF